MPFLKNSVGRSDIFLIFVLFIFSFDILYEKLDQKSLASNSPGP